MLFTCKLCVDGGLLCAIQQSVVNRLSGKCGADVHCRWIRGKEGLELLGHHHALPPREDILGAWKVLQCLLKVAAEDPDALKVWARVKQRDIDPGKSGNFIIGDGRVHFLNMIRSVESIEWQLLPLSL